MTDNSKHPMLKSIDTAVKLYGNKVTTMEDVKNKGLIKKYIISKADGTPLDATAEYFILRLDDGGSDPKHTAACRKAIVTYAKAVKNHLPKLSQELLMMYDPKSYKPETFGQQAR